MERRKGGFVLIGWKAVVLIPIVVPVILFCKLFGIGQYTDRSAEDVAGYIRDFLEETDGTWDWDDFISCPIRDPKVEAIRKEALGVDLPMTEAGREDLQRLLVKAEGLVAASRSPSVEGLRS